MYLHFYIIYFIIAYDNYIKDNVFGSFVVKVYLLRIEFTNGMNHNLLEKYFIYN